MYRNDCVSTPDGCGIALRILGDNVCVLLARDGPTRNYHIRTVYAVRLPLDGQLNATGLAVTAQR